MPTLSAAFRVSADYIDWAHSSAADDGQPVACRIMELPVRAARTTRAHYLIDDAQLVAEIADVAEMYAIGSDRDMRACRVRIRALAWLAARGLKVKQLLDAAHAECAL